ncbi:MAG: cyclic nucleotide-binding domain-containing protein [Spirochaetes bacterium]|nr:cyclic nucleotide-binding domain-containing protein [Spirochaetota bacterium]MBN2772037.1 cyclic nucleotide-binding domain-containing protein [Spirochaetota bacterium]
MHDLALWKNILIALSPVVVFYLIYARYSSSYPDLSKQLQAFIAGIIAALLIIVIKPYVILLVPSGNLWISAFIKAAFLEKIFVFFLLLAVFRHYPDFTLLEASLSGILLGIGFSVCENIFYALSYGTNTMIIRIIFTVPLHMTTCGIMGYYIGESLYSGSRIYKSYYFVLSLIVPVFFHGLFDYVLLHQNHYVFFASPLLLIVVIIQETILSRSTTVPGLEVMSALALNYEEWNVLSRQPKYDRWMQKSMGRKHTPKVNFFVWRPGAFQALMIIGFIVLSVFGSWFKEDISFYFLLTGWEENLLLIIFPLSIAATIVIVNAVNPEFFKYNELKIPIISNAVIEVEDGIEDNHITYDMTAVNVFINTFEPLGVGNKYTLDIEVPHMRSRIIDGTVIWEKHVIGHSPAGSLIRFNNVTPGFACFIIFRYYVSRFIKGIIFNFHLPGFESIKSFFIHPVSTMRDEKIYKAGELIYGEGENSQSFFFLKKGIVEIYKSHQDEEIPLNILNDGSIFGEMSVFGGARRTHTARALTDCLIAVSDKENLHILVKNNTEFALRLFESLSIRITETENSLYNHIRDLDTKKKENQKLFDSLSMILISTLRDNKNISPELLEFSRLKAIVENINDEIASKLVSVLTCHEQKDIEKIEDSLRYIYSVVEK